MTESKTALITGGASGMGLAVARDLLSKGWKVCICDLNSPKAEDLQVDDSNVIFQAADVADYDALAAVFVAAWSKWKRFDFVFANAGISDNGAFALLAGAPLDGSPPPKPNLKVLDINLTAVTTTIYLALHYFRQNPTPGGKIVATASSAGLYALPYIPVYCASKHGVVGLTRSLAPAYKEQNITINCLCPGFVETGLTSGVARWIPPELITPMSTVLTAVNRFIDGTETGCAAELSVNNIYMRDQVEVSDEAQKTMIGKLGLAVAEFVNARQNQAKS